MSQPSIKNALITNTTAQNQDDNFTQRTSFDILLTILLIFIAVVGVTGNVLTLLSLFVTSKLRTLLKHTSVLVGVLAGSDLVLCGIGVPWYTANLLIGYGPPFSTSSVICHAVEYLCWGWSNVSIWLLFCIAFMRMMSTLYPVWHRTRLAKRTVMWTMVVLCYVISFLPYALGPLAHLYWVEPEHPGTGMCYPNVYWHDNQYSEDVFRAYQIIDAVLHCWLPLFGGLLCYTIIYVRVVRSAKTVAPQFAGNRNASNAPRSAIRTARADRSVMASMSTGSAVRGFAARKSSFIVMSKSVSEQRSDKIKVLVFNFLCNIILTSPAMFIWGLGYAGTVAMFSPFLSKATTVLYFCSFPINPIVYAALSQDFRRVYAETIQKIFCCKPLPSMGVTTMGANNNSITRR